MTSKIDDANKTLRKCLRRTILRHMASGVFILSTVGLVATYSIIGPTGQVRFPFWLRLVMNSGWAVSLLSSAVLLAPYFMVLLARRRMPVAGSFVLSTLVGVSAMVVFSYFFIYLEHHKVRVAVFTFLSMGAQLSFVITIMFHTRRDEFLHIIFEVLTIEAGWYETIKNNKDGVNLLLPHNKRGVVILMTSEGNYVLVTTTAGQHLVNSSLTRLVELAPQDAGLRIHRSHWIRWDQITNLHYLRGNPHVATTSNGDLPVSRAQVPAIKKYLYEASMVNA